MKKYILTTITVAMAAVFTSCEGDEGKLPLMTFKTGGKYISADAEVSRDSAFMIGIDATKAEDRDVLKKFNVSKSINGAANTTWFSKDLSGAEADAYSYDFIDTAAGAAGEVQTYTFTVTNRDGLSKQLSVKVTLK